MTDFDIPDGVEATRLPCEWGDHGLNSLVEAVTTAGVYADAQLRLARATVLGSVQQKYKGDLASAVDRYSEMIMGMILRRNGFAGRIVGEEIGETERYCRPFSATDRLIAICDGLDGTENALHGPDGAERHGPPGGRDAVHRPA